MNFLDAKLKTDKNGKLSVAVCGTTFDLPAKAQDSLTSQSISEKDVILGVRPEHIFLSGDKGADADITATVDVSEMMGSSIHLHLASKWGDIVIVVATTGLPAEQRSGFDRGATIQFTFPNEFIHLFEKESGKRINL